MSTQRTKKPATTADAPALAPVVDAATAAAPAPLGALWEAVLAAPMTAPILAAIGGKENLDGGIAAAMPLITAAATAAIAAAIAGADKAGVRTAAIAAVLPLLPAAITAVAAAVIASPIGAARATTAIQKTWVSDALLQEAVDAAMADGEGGPSLEAFVAALSLGIGADAPLEPMMAADAALAAVTTRHHLLEAFVASSIQKAVAEAAA